MLNYQRVSPAASSRQSGSLDSPTKQHRHEESQKIHHVEIYSFQRKIIDFNSYVESRDDNLFLLDTRKSRKSPDEDFKCSKIAGCESS